MSSENTETKSLVGRWLTSLPGGLSLVYGFGDDNSFSLKAGDGPSTKHGTYEVDATTKPATLVIKLDLLVMPLQLKAIVSFSEEDYVIIRYIDGGEKEFYEGPKDYEQFHFEKEKAAQGEKKAEFELSAEVAALSVQERKAECVKVLLSSSMSAGLESMGSADGLGGAIAGLVQAGEAGSEMQSVMASTYLHKSIEMTGAQSGVFAKYGFTAEEMSGYMEEPEMQAIAQQAMMEQMGQLFGGMGLGVGNDGSGLAALAEMMQQQQAPNSNGNGPSEADSGFAAGMQAAMAMMGGSDGAAADPNAAAPLDFGAFGAPPANPPAADGFDPSLFAQLGALQGGNPDQPGSRLDESNPSDLPPPDCNQQ